MRHLYGFTLWLIGAIAVQGCIKFNTKKSTTTSVNVAGSGLLSDMNLDRAELNCGDYSATANPVVGDDTFDLEFSVDKASVSGVDCFVLVFGTPKTSEAIDWTSTSKTEGLVLGSKLAQVTDDLELNLDFYKTYQKKSN